MAAFALTVSQPAAAHHADALEIAANAGGCLASETGGDGRSGLWSETGAPDIDRRVFRPRYYHIFS